jgi:drug/metabolite transporter (DMT)-like permease
MNKSDFRLTPLVVLCLAATWLVWGSTYLAIKFALVSLPPFFQMGTRFLVAGLVLLAWMKFRGAKMPSALQWRNALIVGALMLGGGMGGIAYAEQTVASGLIVTFIAVQPMVQALLHSLWRVFPTRYEIAGIVVGAFGVLLLVKGQGFSGSNIGLLASSVAIFTWAVGSVLSQRVYLLAPGATGFASEMILGGVVLMLMSQLSGETVPTTISTKAALAWVYLVVFGSLVAFNAYMVLLKVAPPALATSYSFVNPVVGLGLGVLIGNEVVSKGEWASAAIIVVGVVMIVVAALKKQQAAYS